MRGSFWSVLILLIALGTSASRAAEETVSVTGKVTKYISEDIEKNIYKEGFVIQHKDPLTNSSKTYEIKNLIDDEYLDKEINVQGLLDEKGGIKAGTITTSNPSPQNNSSIDLPDDIKIGVFVIEWNDQSHNNPIVLDELSNVYFGSNQSASANVKTFYENLSQNSLQITGDVLGTYTLDFSWRSACQIDAWRSAAEEQARMHGVNVNDYDIKVLVMPSNECSSNQGFLGLAYGVISRDENPTVLIVGGSAYDSRVAIHEIGHILGMHHARSQFPNSTVTHEYGEQTDVMGSGAAGQLINAPNRYFYKWGNVNDNTVMSIDSTNTTSNVYYLSDLDNANDNGLKALRIEDPSNALRRYLSYRPSLGNTTHYGNSGMVYLHTSSERVRSGTILRDVLAVGESYTDEILGLRYTVESTSTANAQVRVDRISSNNTGSKPSPTAALLETPQNIISASAITESAPLISWDSVIGATEYRLIIERFNDYPQTGVTEIIDARTTNKYYQIFNNLIPGYYRIKVKARNEAGWGDRGLGFFNVAPKFLTVPEPVSGISPSFGQTVTINNPTITWNASSTADMYDVIIESLPGGAIVSREMLSVTSYQTSNLSNGNYRIKIRARNTAGFSEVTRAFFEVVVPISKNPNPKNQGASK